MKSDRSRSSPIREAAPLLLGAIVTTIVLISSISAVKAATESVLYSFHNNGTDGLQPYAGVIAVKGVLYGTTARGGTGTCTQIPPYGCGTVFVLNPTTGTEKILYSFQNTGEDGEGPNGLIKSGTNLYGTTIIGGTFGAGTVFSVNRKTGAEAVLYSFQGAYKDGGGPETALLDVNGVLYGTTSGGGSYQAGTVFSIDLTDGSESIVYSFCERRYCFDGEYPSGDLVSVSGILYGATGGGGIVNHGTLFSVDPPNRSESVLYSFCQKGNCQDGDSPNGALVYIKGKLYGLTSGGGTYGYGIIFSLDLATGKEKVLYSFQGGNDGIQPRAGLVQVGSTLYGTTDAGGGGGGCDYGCGTVFSFDRKTGAEKILHAFADDGTDGAVPEAGLVNVDGTLYGTTIYGGTDDYGTVFAITP